MAGPAILMLVTFLAVPFVLAFVLSFTNQRLLSPNPTEFVGSDNFARLLTVRLLTLEPGHRCRDGEPQREASRRARLSHGPRLHAEEPGLTPSSTGFRNSWTSASATRRSIILVGDAVFIRSLVNTIVFTMVIVPVQGGLALLLALLINGRMPGVNIFRTIYFIPVVMSMVVISLLWRFIYSPQGGLAERHRSAPSRSGP